MKAKCGKYGHIWKHVCISNNQNLLKPARIADCIENLRCGFLFVWNSFSIRAGTFPRVKTSQKSFAMEFKSATGIQLPAWLFCDHFAAASPNRKVFEMMSDLAEFRKITTQTFVISFLAILTPRIANNYMYTYIYIYIIWIDVFLWHVPQISTDYIDSIRPPLQVAPLPPNMKGGEAPIGKRDYFTQVL